MIKYLLCLLSGTAGAIVFTAVHTTLHVQTVGIVRMDALLGTHIEAQGRQAHSAEDAEHTATRFSAALDETLAQVAQEYRVVLLVAPAVVSSAPDYTEIVKQRIAQRLPRDE